MAFECELCGKGPKVANNVSHSNIKTKRVQKPNLHNVHILKDGHKTQIRICTRCLRSGKVTKAG